MASLDTLDLLLSRGVATPAELQRELAVSQPTLSRLVRQRGEGIVRVGGGRGARYGLRRELPLIGSSWPVFVVDKKGTPTSYGQLTALARDQYWFEAAGGRHNLLSDGLPYFLQDLWPQGFIGRTAPKRFPELGLPGRITDWNEAHALTYLTRRGEDCVGNLMLGDESLQRYLADPLEEYGHIPHAARDINYARLADEAIAGTPAGSSAAGEHPKFSTTVRADDTVFHVLVKFSPPIADRVSQRWSDLLIAEHLASKALGDVGVAAAATELVTGGGRTFLESRRFDRTGERGRIAVVSLAALVDHHIGRRDNWMSAATSLAALGAITAPAAETMRRAATFGQLIGNTDMHFGNLSFFFSSTGPLQLTPVYDMLPMIYAPVGGDELPERKFEPPLPTAGNLDSWPSIAQRAVDYWRELAAHVRVSPEFSQLARDNAVIVTRAAQRVT
jgi:hypothetical protein